MINALIRNSLKYRVSIIFLSLLLLGYGSWVGSNLTIDVFPDLNRPKVTIITEAHGLAPEEVETLVTIPVETVLNGTPGVIGIRSSSGIGISIIHLDFDWGTDVFRNRQLVSERLQLARERLPDDIQPTLAPITSIMGEIQFVGLVQENSNISPIEMRTLADWTIRPALMSIPGISQVVVMGGGVKQYQILISAEKLQERSISLEQLKHALSHISENTTGGFLNQDDKEFMIRPMGRANSIEDIEDTAVGVHLGRTVLLKEVAKVRIGAKEKRGNGSINAQPAVVLTIQKQPGADTISLTKRIDALIGDLQKGMPEGVRIETDLFRQSNFIQASIANVVEALRDGAVMVAIILFLFLLNFRTTFITLTAIPMSFVITFIIFRWLGLEINTMTLGGLAIAVGELVDDAIVDVENVFRRLRENKLAGNPRHPLRVVYEASKEIRNSIVISTIIVVAVFIPLFALSGLEGRFFTPLGISYIISLTASLFVSLTLTPVLCYFLLPNSKAIGRAEEGALIQKLKNYTKPIVQFAIESPRLIGGFWLGLLMIAIVGVFNLGANFLPHFNEGTATIGVAAYPGIALPSSDVLGTKIEEAILSVPEVKSTVRRTGRAEMDEHAEGVHWSEIDVDFHEDGRDRSIVMEEIRQKILAAGDVYVNLGQPIGHRIDHMMSGVRAQIAIKIFGPDLTEQRFLASDVERILKSISGLTDIQIEPLVKVPQLQIAMDRLSASKFAISPGALAEDLELVLRGEEVGIFIEQQRRFDILVRLDEESRNSPATIEDLIVKTMPSGDLVRMRDIAEVYETDGPNMVNRENLLRRIIVSANSSGRSLSELMEEIRSKIDSEIKVPTGYFIGYGGQYESQQAATRKITLLGLLSILIILLVLYMNFRSIAVALLILSNIPLALIGSVAAIWISGDSLSLASMVAFITLCGISTRNGVLMVNHYIGLARAASNRITREIIIQGTLERLIPVCMTAGTAILALSPLLFAKGEPGKEILHPVAVVIVGGLITSTILNTLITPMLFYRFGHKSIELRESDAKILED